MIGALRERIEILRPQRLADHGGGYRFTYAVESETAASVESRSGAAERIGERRLRRRRRRFIIRYRDDLTFEMRIRHRGVSYQIMDIGADDSARKFSIVDGQEVVQ